MVMYALVFKDELLIEWQAEGIEEASREKEDILSMENDLKDDKEIAKDKNKEDELVKSRSSLDYLSIFDEVKLN